jgi:ribonuclease E
MTTDDTDNGWDSLAEDLGVASPSQAPQAEKPSSKSRTPQRPAPSHRDPRPEVEQEADDFASGLGAEPPARAALYDPGPETVVDHAADLEETVDPADDGVEGDEPTARDEGEAGEGGKRRRRRRRRKRKGGPGESAEGGSVTEETDEEAATVEEGEAPAPLENDDEDDDEAAPSAVDEEMEAEAAQPRPEWHVMSWHELVSKLHRPG